MHFPEEGSVVGKIFRVLANQKNSGPVPGQRFVYQSSAMGLGCHD
jgi:hypothetical protein